MDPPLPCHPPSYWLRLFSSQTFSRINTPTFLKPNSFFTPTCLWRWNIQSVPKSGHIKFRHQGINQKKAYSMCIACVILYLLTVRTGINISHWLDLTVMRWYCCNKRSVLWDLFPSFFGLWCVFVCVLMGYEHILTYINKIKFTFWPVCSLLCTRVAYHLVLHVWLSWNLWRN